MPPETTSKTDVDSSEWTSFRLDLQGYAVHTNVLDSSYVRELNRVIDAQLLPPPTTYNRFGTAPRGAGFFDWDPAFLHLIDEESVSKSLAHLLGYRFFLRKIYGIYEQPFVSSRSPTADFDPKNPALQQALCCSVVWNLTDTGRGIGGFSCIAGSHRLDVPADMRSSNLQNVDLLSTPEAPAGSAIVFSSGLRHAHVEWHGPHHRRSLVFEYATMAPSDSETKIDAPWHGTLTDQQLAILGH